MNELTRNHFIDDFIIQDLDGGVYDEIHTRFPPEPNGYLHIGHAKAICLNFLTARKYGGTCNLRFDDTNPSKEETEYVRSIMADISWLGFQWDNLFYASDYFEQFYEYAIRLIEKGKAFVCDLTPDEIREHRGTLTSPGKPSPYRDRSAEENLDLFERMRAGEFADGAKVLRAKIDMASPNINLRDPVIYRISRAHHHRTGDAWCIYPMYDYAHPLEDAIEGITHSLCTMEFEDHRPLYDWVIREVGFKTPPRQIEFARLNMTETIMSKRYLKRLVDERIVSGWDDPRMPTLSGMRRRGIPSAAIRAFCDEIGISKTNSVVDYHMLEHFVREALGPAVKRVMAVLNPVKVVIANYPEGQTETLTLENNPDDPNAGTRGVTFSREVYIEREDFMENPPGKFFRLAPGREVRLKGAYIIKCESVAKDAQGNITEIICTYDPETKSGSEAGQRKVKGTLHWVDCASAAAITARLYENLLTDDSKDAELLERLNPDSLTELHGFAEPALRDCEPGDSFQFMRMGYFCRDIDDGAIFNRIVGLRDSWAKINQK